MNTYYKQENGNFIETSVSLDDAIEAVAKSASKDAVNRINSIIINTVTVRVEEAVNASDIKGMVDNYLSTANLSDSIGDVVSKAIENHDIESAIDNVIDDMDLYEMIKEKVDDHLESCSIQVSIR